MLVEPTRGYVSVADEKIRAIYKAALSPKFAGYNPIADDKRPPSRAFKKLREAIEVFALSLKKGQTAVDLGASPGGWTYVLRELGLSVTAIDRSPLSEALMRDRMISWSAGNALTWQPPTPVDWLVCDVITSPENTSGLLERWISKGLCRNFCITVKFKGTPATETLLSLAAFLRTNTSWFDGRQLTHNKNELTIVGSR
jgi:23S rRNA (cytidine2498-2'-O)-methyltransferase